MNADQTSLVRELVIDAGRTILGERHPLVGDSAHGGVHAIVILDAVRIRTPPGDVGTDRPIEAMIQFHERSGVDRAHIQNTIAVGGAHPEFFIRVDTPGDDAVLRTDRVSLVVGRRGV